MYDYQTPDELILLEIEKYPGALRSKKTQETFLNSQITKINYPKDPTTIKTKNHKVNKQSTQYHQHSQYYPSPYHHSFGLNNPEDSPYISQYSHPSHNPNQYTPHSKEIPPPIQEFLDGEKQRNFLRQYRKYKATLIQRWWRWTQWKKYVRNKTIFLQNFIMLWVNNIIDEEVNIIYQDYWIDYNANQQTELIMNDTVDSLVYDIIHDLFLDNICVDLVSLMTMETVHHISKEVVRECLMEYVDVYLEEVDETKRERKMLCNCYHCPQSIESELGVEIFEEVLGPLIYFVVRDTVGCCADDYIEYQACEIVYDEILSSLIYENVAWLLLSERRNIMFQKR